MELANVVRSRAGHDKGKWFAIVALEGDFAMIADGKNRPLERPKRKRLRHLAPTDTVLTAEEMRTDRQLRSALARFGDRCDKEVCDLGKG